MSCNIIDRNAKKKININNTQLYDLNVIFLFVAVYTPDVILQLWDDLLCMKALRLQKTAGGIILIFLKLDQLCVSVRNV